MKTIGSRWSAVALVLGTTTGFGCSSDTAETGPGSGGDTDPPGIGTTPDPGTQGTAPQLRAAPGKTPGAVTPGRAVITGIVTDLGSGGPGLRLGGKGTLANAGTVRLSGLSGSGDLKLLTEVSINASGTFSAQAPLNVDLIIAQVLDLSGRVLGSAIIGGSGSIA